MNYTSNVYIIKDPAHPENEGQVKLYRFGKKIFDKINDLMNPEFEDESPVNPFDLWAGANFKMKIRKVEGYSNYDKSEFEAPSPLLDDDDRMEESWNSEHSLKELISPDKFKSYEDLKTKLDRVLGLGATTAPKPEEVPFDGGQPMTAAQAAVTPPVATAETDTSEEYSYFSKLAEGN